MIILLWPLLCAIAGCLKGVVMKTRKQQGLLMDIVVGIVVALLGGWIFGLFGAQGVSGFGLHSLFVAFVGAVFLLAILRAVRRRGARPRSWLERARTSARPA